MNVSNVSSAANWQAETKAPAKSTQPSPAASAALAYNVPKSAAVDSDGDHDGSTLNKLA
jgi:hypothetical protein